MSKGVIQCFLNLPYVARLWTMGHLHEYAVQYHNVHRDPGILLLANRPLYECEIRADLVVAS